MTQNNEELPLTEAAEETVTPTSELAAVAKEFGVSDSIKNALIASISSVFEAAEAFEKTASSIVVKDIDDSASMDMADEIRLTVKRKRLEGTNFIKAERGKLKQKMADDVLHDKLLMATQAIMEAKFTNIESSLQEKVNYRITRLAEIYDERKTSRTLAFSSNEIALPAFDFAAMDDDSFNTFLNGLIADKKQKAKDEADRIAAENKRKADEEAERLKKEKEEKEKAELKRIADQRTADRITQIWMMGFIPFTDGQYVCMQDLNIVSKEIESLEAPEWDLLINNFQDKIALKKKQEAEIAAKQKAKEEEAQRLRLKKEADEKAAKEIEAAKQKLAKEEADRVAEARRIADEAEAKKQAEAAASAKAAQLAPDRDKILVFLKSIEATALSADSIELKSEEAKLLLANTKGLLNKIIAFVKSNSIINQQ